MGHAVAWFTGLSGSGKSTISEQTALILRNQGQSVQVLDGDAVRKTHQPPLGFSPEDIRENNRLMVKLCQESISEYDVILVPIISPFRGSRHHARRMLGQAFVEVYIKASLDEVMRRDPKGLYRQVREGSLSGFVGIDSQVPYEPPENPELILDTEMLSVNECASTLAGLLSKKAAVAW